MAPSPFPNNLDGLQRNNWTARKRFCNPKTRAQTAKASHHPMFEMWFCSRKWLQTAQGDPCVWKSLEKRHVKLRLHAHMVCFLLHILQPCKGTVGPESQAVCRKERTLVQIQDGLAQIILSYTGTTSLPSLSLHKYDRELLTKALFIHRKNPARFLIAEMARAVI